MTFEPLWSSTNLKSYKMEFFCTGSYTSSPCKTNIN
jgi:hypothetical protein